MTAYVRVAVLKHYGEDGGSVPKICPGEDACELFLSASGKTRAAKARNVCNGCDLLPTKRTGYKKVAENLESLVDSAFRIRRSRQSGFPITENRVTPLEYETLLMVDELCEYQEIKMRKETNACLMAGFGLKQD